MIFKQQIITIYVTLIFLSLLINVLYGHQETCDYYSTTQECCGGTGYLYTGKQNVSCLASPDATACSPSLLVGNATVNSSYAIYNFGQELCTCHYSLQSCRPTWSLGNGLCTQNITSTCCPNTNNVEATCSQIDKSKCSEGKFDITCGGNSKDAVCPGNSTFGLSKGLTLASSEILFDWWFNSTSRGINYSCSCYYVYSAGCVYPTKKPTPLPTKLPTRTGTPTNPPTSIPTLAPTRETTAASYFAMYDAIINVIYSNKKLTVDVCTYDWNTYVFDKIFENATSSYITDNCYVSINTTRLDFNVTVRWRTKSGFASDESKVKAVSTEISLDAPYGIMDINVTVVDFSCPECYTINSAFTKNNNKILYIPLTIFIAFLLFLL